MKYSINYKTRYTYTLFLLCVLLLAACDQDGSFNVFSIQDDIALGQQVSAEIDGNPQQYPVLPETGRNGRNEQAYQYLRNITSKILNSGDVTYRDEFPWKVKIIHDDKILNAFCTPGGYIYVYTGLIKYLDTEDQLAGVMGHEIAHADKRHTTDNLTKAYGWQLLIDIVVGSNQGAVTEIAKSLASLSYSRAAERQADDYSVIYLCPTDYQSDGAADFFEKMQQEGTGGRVPEFISTHPNPDNRIESIRQKAREENCNTDKASNTQYTTFKGLLP